ncbi:transcription antitermination factor NusG [Rhodoblastus acidophilus]|uniref:transcription termination/antitermination protein NusG n=1 Tax=Rhodoblastus acidophilus TaxID=1074 RepID=UPI0018B093E7|nr:transcription termination/antitermination NusG family protein [Rhodoblastus acidophilus]MCW2276364.1 transcription antitermination factor NusG [Rhodoblastus acidophilus]
MRALAQEKIEFHMQKPSLSSQILPNGFYSKTYGREVFENSGRDGRMAVFACSARGEGMMDRQFWGVAAVKQGVKALGERREFAFGARMLPEPACNAAAREALEAAGFDVFAPSIVEQRWRTSRAGKQEKAKAAAFPLFPGYLFFGWNDFDQWSAAPHVRGVVDVLRDGDRFSPPALIPRWKMIMLMAAGAMIDAAALVKAEPGLDVGAGVEIKSGPFAGMMAHITNFDGKKRMRAFLDLDALGGRQQFELKVDVSELTRMTA